MKYDKAFELVEVVEGGRVEAGSQMQRMQVCNSKSARNLAHGASARSTAKTVLGSWCYFWKLAGSHWC
tara:strand:+ start:539 stop:742 length:204 start_codon:yes stop_codon:yes gene_type:complete